MRLLRLSIVRVAIIAGTLQPEVKTSAPENMGEVMPYFMMLRRNLENEDYDAADLVVNEIKKYRYPEEVEGLVRDLLAQVMELDTEEALQTIETIYTKAGI